MDNNDMYNKDNAEQNWSNTGTGPQPEPNSNADPNQNFSYDQSNGYMDNNMNANQGYGYGYEQQNGYSGNNQGYQYPPQGGYQQELEEPVSMGEWLISMLLIMFIPCVNIVLMFVWAFSKKEKKSKSNFFKAQLILNGIILALYIVIFLIFGASFLAAMSY